MRRLIFLLACTAFFACSNDSKYPKAENALDAGREFLDGFLKGNTSKARAYMVDDEQNQELLRKGHRKYEQLSTEGKQELQKSSLIIGQIEDITENEVIIQYKNSYDRIGRKIKVVNKDGEWLVDLKYTMNPNL